MSELIVDDVAVSLSQLANINMEEVTEVRGFGLPRGVYHFLCKTGKLTVIEGGQEKWPAGQFECEVRGVLSLADTPEGETPPNPESLLGKVHTQSFFIRKAADDIGRIKAFCADIGGTTAGVTLEEMCASAQGCEFVAPITRKPKKGDPDTEYVNINIEKIKRPGQEAA